jgi:hypothetical protein
LDAAGLNSHFLMGLLPDTFTDLGLPPADANHATCQPLLPHRVNGTDSTLSRPKSQQFESSTKLKFYLLDEGKNMSKVIAALITSLFASVAFAQSPAPAAPATSGTPAAASAPTKAKAEAPKATKAKKVTKAKKATTAKKGVKADKTADKAAASKTADKPATSKAADTAK